MYLDEALLRDRRRDALAFLDHVEGFLESTLERDLDAFPFPSFTIYDEWESDVYAIVRTALMPTLQSRSWFEPTRSATKVLSSTFWAHWNKLVQEFGQPARTQLSQFPGPAAPSGGAGTGAKEGIGSGRRAKNAPARRGRWQRRLRGGCRDDRSADPRSAGSLALKHQLLRPAAPPPTTLLTLQPAPEVLRGSARARSRRRPAAAIRASSGDTSSSRRAASCSRGARRPG